MYASFIFHWLHIPSISTQQNLKQNKFKWILFSYKYEVRIFNHILCSVNVDFKYVLSILKSKVMSCLFLQKFYCLYTTYSFFQDHTRTTLKERTMQYRIFLRLRIILNVSCLQKFFFIHQRIFHRMLMLKCQAFIRTKLTKKVCRRMTPTQVTWQKTQKI